MSPTVVHPRADACPGALRLHEAVDGFVARVRVPGGRLTPAQLLSLRDLAGDGVVHLTSRGNVQLRGLRVDGGAALADGLEQAGLLPSRTHERARNVLASPLSGLDDLGHADVRPVLAELDTALCADPLLAELPGRFLLGLDDGRGDVLGLGLDAGVQAGPDGWVLWRGGLRVGPVTDPVEALLEVARDFMRQRDGVGTWRVAGDLAGGVSSGHVGRVLADGWQTAVVAVAPLQQLLPHQVEVLSHAEHLVLTPWHAVVVEGGDACALRTAGLVTDPGDPWTRTTACAGLACPKALADVRADAAHSVREAPAGRVHWSGCGRRCGRPRGELLDVVATPDGYTREHTR